MPNFICRLCVCILVTVFFQLAVIVNESTAQSGLPGREGGLSIGYMSGDRGLSAGYTGLVLPGTCVSSYFVYNLGGVRASGSVKGFEWNRFSTRLRGDYLFAFDVAADQEITWLTIPPGTRHWESAKSSFYILEGELSYLIDDSLDFISGVRWESLSTSFSDPDPDYPFTIAAMESGLGIGIYQPFVGARVQKRAGSNLVSARLVGFPVMLATLEHFNTCNNEGKPFAHVGNQDIRGGYFVELSAEARSMNILGVEAGVFVNWELYRGSCIMNLERRAMGPPESVSAADVDFVYNRSSLTVGANMSIPFRSPL